MHKQRIIAGIEKVLEGYAKDTELLGAIKVGDPRWFTLFSRLKTVGEYILLDDGRIALNAYQDSRYSSAREAAEEYSNLLIYKHICHVTVATVEAILRKNVGQRVEEFKRNYAKHFDNECDRQAEDRYVQHPEV